MDVIFTIDDFGNSEAEALAAAAEGRAPEEEEYLWGAIALSHPGQPTVTLRDDLLAMAGSLCATVVTRLRAGQPVDLALTAWPGHFSFVLVDGGDAVRVTGPAGEDASYPRADLLSALSGCGSRLVDCMRELADVSPQYGHAAEALARELATG